MSKAPQAQARLDSPTVVAQPAVWVRARRIPRADARPAYDAVKRLLDLICSTVLLLLGAPVLALCVIAIRLESPGAAIFRQTRVGRGGREFVCFKLRTMTDKSDSQAHQEYLRYLIEHSADAVAVHRPEREITRVGYWLRKTSLDEMPQLFNVLRGEMSLVGPRPPIPYEVTCYQQWHLRRLEVTPGLTGYWQITGRGRVTFDEMCRMDIAYIDRRSLRLDLLILLKTPWAALRGSG